jgi:beta-lactamase superfamily II metal-dependent hydrolase
VIFKVFDVAHGSANFLISPTGMTELIDLGARSDWSPLDHIYGKYISRGGRLDRIVLTHHHGDHVDDVYKLSANRMPAVVLRRLLSGRYEQACRGSNSEGGQDKARYFDQLFSGYTQTVAASPATGNPWGIEKYTWSLTEAQADRVGGSDGGMVNCCSFVTLYDHLGTKILQCGDMEKDGMALLLALNPDMQKAVRGVNILLAPHHGHKSSYSADLMNAIGRPALVIASVMTGDEHVDGRYSNEQYVTGVRWSDGTTKRLLTTRNDGAVTVQSNGYGGFQVTTHQR